MHYYVIYDGNCNLCATLVQLLETLNQGDRLQYMPMQDQQTLSQFGITSQDCEQGMIVINAAMPEQRWQGSEAAETIGRLLPLGNVFVSAYRALPGAKWTGDRAYAQIRDHRYTLFGRCDRTYQPRYPVVCASDRCRL